MNIILTLTLRHFEFPDGIVDYLVDKSTQYFWNLFIFGTCDTDVGIGQGFTYSLTLSVLYIAPHIHIFELRA